MDRCSGLPNICRGLLIREGRRRAIHRSLPLHQLRERRPFSSTSPSTGITPTTPVAEISPPSSKWSTLDASKVGKIVPRKSVGQGTKKGKPSSINLLLTAGLPFILFSVFASWVVSQALQGKLREMETAQGKKSQSLRQAAMEQEHDEMMERLSKIVQQDFDNTKRVKRPHEILEERRLERERRNAWHRRAYRWITGQKEEDPTTKE